MRIAVLAVALAALLLVTGCNTRQRIAGAATAVAVVGVGLTWSTEARSDEESGTRGKVGIAMLLTGLVTLFVVAALDETAKEPKPLEIKATNPHGDPPEVRQMEARAVATEQANRHQAWELTKQAYTAARANDCAKVTELSAQVGALDPELFADVFMKDIAVQRCFTPAPVPTTAPPLPPPTVQ
jgi:hypothetical protein